MNISVAWSNASQQCPYQQTERVSKALFCQFPDKTFYHTMLFFERHIYKTDRRENKLAFFLSVCIHRSPCSWQFPSAISSSYWYVCLRDNYCLVLSWVLLFLLKLFYESNLWLFFPLDLNTLVSGGRVRPGFLSTSFDGATYQVFFQTDLVSSLQDSYGINHNSGWILSSLPTGVWKVFAMFSFGPW